MAVIDRKESGSLLHKPLLLAPEQLAFGAEREFPMFATVLLVVAKGRDKEFLATYEHLDTMQEHVIEVRIKITLPLPHSFSKCHVVPLH